MTVLNAEDKILGRLASEIASKARDGEEVKVVNSEEAVISGDEEKVKADYKQKKDRGARHDGPYFPKAPDRILKRTVKGMLPDNRDGREALEKVKTYIGVPEDLEPEDADTKEGGNLKNRNYVKLGDVSSYIGWTRPGEKQ